MKRNIMFAALFLIVMASCQSTDNRTVNPNYRTGTAGLTADFYANQPPSQIYQEEDLNAVIKIENKGTSAVGYPGDRIYLSGFEPTIITNIPTNGIQIPKLAGKDQYRSTGDQDTVIFRGVIRQSAFARVDKYTPKLLVTACYGYETVAQGNICLDPDPFTPTSSKKVCTPTTVSLGSQGAPIAVTQVQVQPSPNKARFVISISNSGNGQVFRYGATYLSKCSPYVNPGLNIYDDLDYILVEDVRVGDTSIKSSCRPLNQGSLRLEKNTGTLFCELANIRGSSAYVTPILVVLKYGYRTTLTKDITILRD